MVREVILQVCPMKIRARLVERELETRGKDTCTGVIRISGDREAPRRIVDAARGDDRPHSAGGCCKHVPLNPSSFVRTDPHILNVEWGL